MTSNQDFHSSSKIRSFLEIAGISEEEIVRSLNASSINEITPRDALKAVHENRLPLVFKGKEKSFRAEIAVFDRLENGSYFLIILVNQNKSENEIGEPFMLDIRTEASSLAEDELILDVLNTIKEKLLSGEICGSSLISFTRNGISISDFFPEFEV